MNWHPRRRQRGTVGGDILFKWKCNARAAVRGQDRGNVVSSMGDLQEEVRRYLLPPPSAVMDNCRYGVAADEAHLRPHSACAPLARKVDSPRALPCCDGASKQAQIILTCDKKILTGRESTKFWLTACSSHPSSARERRRCLSRRRSPLLIEKPHSC